MSLLAIVAALLFAYFVASGPCAALLYVAAYGVGYREGLAAFRRGPLKPPAQFREELRRTSGYPDIVPYRRHA